MWSFDFLVFSLGLPALMKAMRMEGVDVDTVLGLGHLAQIYSVVTLGSGV